MKTIKIKIDFIKPSNRLVSFTSFIVNVNIYLSSVATHKKLNSSAYCSPYSRKEKFSLFYPINKKANNRIEKAVFAKLKDVIRKIKSG